MDFNLFQKGMISTWVQKPNEAILEWIKFYEKETGRKIDKMNFEQNPNGENFMDIMTQIQTQSLLGEEIKRIKSLLY